MGHQCRELSAGGRSRAAEAPGPDPQAAPSEATYPYQAICPTFPDAGKRYMNRSGKFSQQYYMEAGRGRGVRGAPLGLGSDPA